MGWADSVGQAAQEQQHGGQGDGAPTNATGIGRIDENGHIGGTGTGKSRPIGLLESGGALARDLKKLSEPGPVGC